METAVTNVHTHTHTYSPLNITGPMLSNFLRTLFNRRDVKDKTFIYPLVVFIYQLPGR